MPTTRPGHSLPHAWLSHGGSRESVHRLIAPRGLTLLVDAEHAPRWEAAARAVGKTGATVQVRAIDSGTDWTDPTGEWATLREVGGDGALLVRPDRHIAWRALSWTDDRPAELGRALHAVLGLRPARPN